MEPPFPHHNIANRSIYIIYQGTSFRLPFGSKIKMSLPENLCEQAVSNPKALYPLESEMLRLFQEDYPNTPLPDDFWDTVSVEAVHPVSGVEIVREKLEEVEQDREQKLFWLTERVLAVIKLPLFVLGIWLTILLGVLAYGLLASL